VGIDDIRASESALAVLLVVDDDPHSRELEQVILELAGYQVLRASNGPTAIALLETGTPLEAVANKEPRWQG
jgi:CheY-like chemotaxis protein